MKKKTFEFIFVQLLLDVVNHFDVSMTIFFLLSVTRTTQSFLQLTTPHWKSYCHWKGRLYLTNLWYKIVCKCKFTHSNRNDFLMKIEVSIRSIRYAYLWIHERKSDQRLCYVPPTIHSPFAECCLSRKFTYLVALYDKRTKKFYIQRSILIFITIIIWWPFRNKGFTSKVHYKNLLLLLKLNQLKTFESNRWNDHSHKKIYRF